VAASLKKIFGIDEIPINIPPKREMGDLSSAVCLSLAKEKRRPPLEIAKEVVEQLKTNHPAYIEEINLSPPGYINFKVQWPKLTKELIHEVFEKVNLFGQPIPSEREKVFVEHTSVNPNKAMHIGHLRNSVLGDTVARVLQWSGFPAEVCNYIDDTGVQVVDVVTAFFYLDPPFFHEGSADLRPI